jgi:hypothetical protein
MPIGPRSGQEEKLQRLALIAFSRRNVLSSGEDGAKQTIAFRFDSLPASTTVNWLAPAPARPPLASMGALIAWVCISDIGNVRTRQYPVWSASQIPEDR